MKEKSREDCVREFHVAFGLDVNAEPTARLFEFRRKLLTEEMKELLDEFDTAISLLEKGEEVPREVYVNMLKELADVQFVTSGASVALSPLRNLSEAFERVHKSNMSKLGKDGKPIYREDGKVLKGPDYTPPTLDDLV